MLYLFPSFYFQPAQYCCILRGFLTDSLYLGHIFKSTLPISLLIAVFRPIILNVITLEPKSATLSFVFCLSLFPTFLWATLILLRTLFWLIYSHFKCILLYRCFSDYFGIILYIDITVFGCFYFISMNEVKISYLSYILLLSPVYNCLTYISPSSCKGNGLGS